MSSKAHAPFELLRRMGLALKLALLMHKMCQWRMNSVELRAFSLPTGEPHAEGSQLDLSYVKKCCSQIPAFIDPHRLPNFDMLSGLQTGFVY